MLFLLRNTVKLKSSETKCFEIPELPDQASNRKHEEQ